MTDWLGEFTRFLVLDGALLIGLFLLVTWGVVLAQQRFPFQAQQGRLLGASGFKASFLASVGGVVTPFCSCSTIPALNGMLRAGVGFAPSFAFLVSSPVVNEGVFILLFLTHGAWPGLVFIATGLALTTVAGVVAARIGLGRHVAIMSTAPSGATFVGDASRPAWPGLAPASRFAWRAAREELRRTGPYLALGLLVGGLIYGAVPTHTLLTLVDALPLPALYLVCALVGLPLYISPVAALPIGLALLEKGFPGGPLVTFLVAAIGTSPPEVVLLFRMFRLPLVVAHTLTVLGCALLLGLIVALTL
ncbi:permease [Lysobacter sp. SG-8]|uniref:Permease n=1 Tax=Marilutibacter penaei TaxID=2759900 RepID=A0A7W3U2W6_9GAMM|nr:permease [Lysobacter penaei]MBB1087922.1 permease [Lysobacter penaei]